MEFEEFKREIISDFFSTDRFVKDEVMDYDGIKYTEPSFKLVTDAINFTKNLLNRFVGIEISYSVISTHNKSVILHFVRDQYKLTIDISFDNITYYFKSKLSEHHYKFDKVDNEDSVFDALNDFLNGK